MTVSLGDIYTSTLVGAGASTSWVPFTLNLTACPDGTNAVTAVFSGATDSNGNFSNQGTASDMAVQLQTLSGQQLSSGSSLQTVVDQSQNAAFSLQARAITPGGKPTSGTLQSAINIIYTWQ